MVVYVVELCAVCCFYSVGSVAVAVAKCCCLSSVIVFLALHAYMVVWSVYFVWQRLYLW